MRETYLGLFLPYNDMLFLKTLRKTKLVLERCSVAGVSILFFQESKALLSLEPTLVKVSNRAL